MKPTTTDPEARYTCSATRYFLFVLACCVAFWLVGYVKSRLQL